MKSSMQVVKMATQSGDYGIPVSVVKVSEVIGVKDTV